MSTQGQDVNRRAGGFTLLELLVVLTIVAILSSAAVLGFSALQRDPGRDVADRIAMVWNQVCEQSLLDSRLLGLRIEEDAYQALQPGHGGIWKPLPGTLFALHELTDITLTLSPELPETDALRPQLGCAPEPQLVIIEEGEARFRLAWDVAQQSVRVDDLDATAAIR